MGHVGGTRASAITLAVAVCMPRLLGGTTVHLRALLGSVARDDLIVRRLLALGCAAAAGVAAAHVATAHAAQSTLVWLAVVL